MTSRARIRLLAAASAATLALTLTACAPESAAPDGVTIPDTPAGETTRWVLDVLAADEDTTAEDWEPRLHESFTAQVSAADVAELINVQIRPAAPFTVTGYDGDQVTAVTTIAGAVGEPFDLSVTVDDADQIVGLFFAPAAEP